MEKTVEIFDFDTFGWIFATDLPKAVTGSKLIVVSGQPTLVGRYGEERQQKMLRYSEVEEWEELPVKLLSGRSDFQILNNIQRLVTVNPLMSSHSTLINPGSCGTYNWRNVFGMVENGKKAIFRTNSQVEPWIQLDLGHELLVVIVRTSNFDN